MTKPELVDALRDSDIHAQAWAGFLSPAGAGPSLGARA
jgi:hypothetical protein